MCFQMPLTDGFFFFTICEDNSHNKVLPTHEEPQGVDGHVVCVTPSHVSHFTFSRRLRQKSQRLVFLKILFNVLKLFFVLVYSRLKMLPLFQVDKEGTQLYIIYMYPFFPKLPSHLGCHITLSRVPCAIQ